MEEINIIKQNYLYRKEIKLHKEELARLGQFLLVFWCNC